MEVSPTDLGAVLVWLATGGGAVYLVNALLSLVAENIPAWHGLSSALKFSIGLGMSVLVSIGATLLLARPDIIDAIAPWFAIVMLAALGWVGQQRTYMAAKNAGYGRKPI